LDVMMMSLNEPQRQALGAIADGQAGSDPRLASMLNIFSRLAADAEMPAREKIRVRRGRPPARPRRARRHPRRGTVFPQARRLYARLGWQQAMLLLWAVTSAGLLALALLLNTSGHKTCTQSMGRRAALPLSHTMPMGPTFEPAASRRGLPAQTVGRLRNRSAGPHKRT
jgi:hypothetical protein